MGAISVQMITKELMLACRQLGHVLSEALAALVVSTVINPHTGSFYVERAIDENDAKIVVEEAAKRILAKEEPGIACLRLQASYESEFAELEQEAQKKVAEAGNAEERIVNWVAGFTAKFDQNFDDLTILYKRIYQFLMLRCTGPTSVSRAPKDAVIEREVAAALESVFPRVGLRSFAALTGPEKSAQLQELASIILGIRLFNQHQSKGGAGLPTVETAMTGLKAQELLDRVHREVNEETEICKTFGDLIQAAKSPPQGGPWDKQPAEAEIEKARSDLLYHRQYLCYLLNVQEDLARSLERLRRDQKTLKEELTDLDALVGGRSSVSKEQVYPRFDAVAKGYRTAWREVQALEARQKLHELLGTLRSAYFPAVSDDAQQLVARWREVNPEGDARDEDHADLDGIPGPSGSPQDGMAGGDAIRLTVENSPDFLQLPLDFQGFCIHTLATQNRLLAPGNPALGVVKYAGRFCVFATERSCAEFCAEPEKYFLQVREICYNNPELIHLLRIHEDFPRSSLHAIVQGSAATRSSAALQADAGTECPTHFQESHIDPNYEWNEWKLRKEALHMADIKNKQTSTTQTALSHLRRENETQVYLPKEVATNTTKNQGTAPPGLKRYFGGIRGEPQPMKVFEVKYDL